MSQPPPVPNDDPPTPLSYGQAYPRPAPGAAYPGEAFAPAKTSGAAVASLVLGILGCVPAIAGLLAVILGIVGLRSTGRPGVRGRGLAVAGLILGGLSLLGWSAAGVGGGYLWVSTAPDRAAARQFARSLAAGDEAKATALCQPGLAPGTLRPTLDYLKPDGVLQDTTVTGVNLNASTGTGRVAVITVEMRFPATTKMAVVTLTPGPAGTPLVQSWTVQ